MATTAIIPAKAKNIVDFFPLVSALLAESGNAGQLWKMWAAHTAAGQNIWSFVSILCAVILWIVYFEKNLGKTFAYWMAWVGAVMLSANILTVLYFTYYGRP